VVKPKVDTGFPAAAAWTLASDLRKSTQNGAIVEGTRARMR
jgi:hypothetical protein